MSTKPTATTKNPDPTVRVATLRLGDEVDGLLIVRKKLRREQANGNTFLLFRLADASGEINAVLWQGASIVDTQVELGDVVRVHGAVHDHQNARQIKLAHVEKANVESYDEKIFLPHSERDSDTQYSNLLKVIDSVSNEFLRRLYASVFGDETIRPMFCRAPAGKGWHHAYVGGMLDHVLSMLEIGELLVRQYEALDRDLLIGGILLHDVGKIFELSYERHFEYTTPGRLVGHLVQGCILVSQHMDRIEDFPEELRTRVLHTIVSHHGSEDRGSPKPPMTLEATAVHLLDHLDSQLNAIVKVVGGTKDPQGWTEHVRLAARSFYTGEVKKPAEPSREG